MRDLLVLCYFFFSSRRRHTRFDCDWSSDVCSSDLSVSGPVTPQVTSRVSASVEKYRSEQILFPDNIADFSAICRWCFGRELASDMKYLPVAFGTCIA